MILDKMKSKLESIFLTIIILALSAIIALFAGYIEFTVLNSLNLSEAAAFLETHDYIYLLGNKGANIVFALALLIFTYLLAKNKPSELGMKKSQPGHLVFGLTSGLSIPFAGFWVLLMSGSVNVESASFDFILVILSVLSYIITAFYEEILFRGFLLSRLDGVVRPIVSLVISSLIFTAAHALNPNMTVVSMINIFLAGIFLGNLFIKSKSIWGPIAFHFTWNFSMGTVFGFNVSGLTGDSIIKTRLNNPGIFNGGNAGFEGSVICTVMLLGAIFLLIYKSGKINKKK